jgi:hypothetical protein
VARKYAFNPPKIRFHPNTKLPTNATGKSEKTVRRFRPNTKLPTNATGKSEKTVGFYFSPY